MSEPIVFNQMTMSIESGLERRDQEKKRLLELADSLASSRDPKEQSHLKEELARMTFGE